MIVVDTLLPLAPPTSSLAHTLHQHEARVGRRQFVRGVGVWQTQAIRSVRHILSQSGHDLREVACVIGFGLTRDGCVQRSRHSVLEQQHGALTGPVAHCNHNKQLSCQKHGWTQTKPHVRPAATAYILRMSCMLAYGSSQQSSRRNG